MKVPVTKEKVIGKLIVRVFRAEGLASADINGKSDPFIKMNLVNQFHRTSTQYKTLNPEWNEMFYFDIHDINNHIEFLVYDEDRHGEDFLGRFLVPLLSIKNKKMVWYQLKNKKLTGSAKGKVLVRMDIEWSVIDACIRTFNPLEELVDPPPAVLKKSLMVSNFMRAKAQIMMLIDLINYIKSCFQWQSKLRSITAFVLFIVITYYFELWMLPFTLLAILCFNLALINYPAIRMALGFDEAKYAKLTDIDNIIDNEESLEELDKQLSRIQQGNRELNNNTVTQDQGDDKTIVERLQAGRDVVILIQDILGGIASYLERVTNTFTFKVPFLSYLMMFCLAVATILLYFVPLRYVIMAWGVNKFTKKLRNPNAIDNNELVDFLSRVPDNVQCYKVQNIVTVVSSTS
jgi:hypothetical protein